MAWWREGKEERIFEVSPFSIQENLTCAAHMAGWGGSTWDDEVAPHGMVKWRPRVDMLTFKARSKVVELDSKTTLAWTQTWTRINTGLDSIQDTTWPNWSKYRTRHRHKILNSKLKKLHVLGLKPYFKTWKKWNPNWTSTEGWGASVGFWCPHQIVHQLLRRESVWAESHMLW